MDSDGLRRITEPDPADFRSLSLVPGLLYPVWHLLAPPTASDPWVLWFLVGASFAIVGALSYTTWVSARSLQRMYFACLYLVTIHLYLLAYVNHMALLYAAGSAICPVGAAAVLRSRLALRPYLAFVGSLAVVLFALEPELRKVVFWGASFTILAPAYFRLSSLERSLRRAWNYEEELERRVEERTRELSERTRELREYAEQLRRQSEEKELLEEQLRFSQKMEALGRLSGGIAHDFNNLLTAIGGYTMMLRDVVPKGEPRDDLEQIELAVQQATALVQQLLSFGRQQLVPTTLLDLNEIVQEVSSFVGTLLAEDTEFVTVAREALDPVRANRNQVHQVILNLAINARDAMPHGGRFSIETSMVTRERLDPEVASLAEGDRWVLMAVSDDGVGMDPTVSERAFDPFFTTKGVEQGTGLGLSIVYGIVHQSGGHIRLRSEKGKGTRFEIYWPSAQGEVEQAAAVPAAPVAAGRRETVLLVEDRGDVRRLARRILSRNGYTVIEAANGEEALEIVHDRGQRFDLMVSDVIMPRMSGFDLADELAKSRPDVKVLFISGHLNHPTLRARELPPDVKLLPKPFAPEELVAAVREVLDGDGSPGASDP